MELQERQVNVLKEQGWPADSVSDTLYGAACFMAFGNVLVYKTVPPSHSRPWCAHLAEVVVKGHHNEIFAAKIQPQNALTLSTEASRLREVMVEEMGGSSPIHWQSLNANSSGVFQREYQEFLNFFSIFLEREEPSQLMACPELVAILADPKTGFHHDMDPSVYVAKSNMPVCWEIIQRADQRMAYIIMRLGGYEARSVKLQAETIVAQTIVPLAEVGPPSSGRSSEIMGDWPHIFVNACVGILRSAEIPEDFDSKGLVNYAYLSLMRPAYYTIMMRASGDIGPGITDDSMPDTALAYMA